MLIPRLSNKRKSTQSSLQVVKEEIARKKSCPEEEVVRKKKLPERRVARNKKLSGS
jgi:hypothetical protein